MARINTTLLRKAQLKRESLHNESNFRFVVLKSDDETIPDNDDAKLMFVVDFRPNAHDDYDHNAERPQMRPELANQLSHAKAYEEAIKELRPREQSFTTTTPEALGYQLEGNDSWSLIYSKDGGFYRLLDGRMEPYVDVGNVGFEKKPTTGFKRSKKLGLPM